MSPRAALLAVLLALAGLASSPLAASALELPQGFRDEELITGLREPTAMQFAPDGRLFIAEKSGRVLVFDSLEDPIPDLFADLSPMVYDHGDRGLLGLALDPEFDSGRPYVYALYTYDHVLGTALPAPRWGDPQDPYGDSCDELDEPGVDDCPVSGRLVRMTAVGNAAETGPGGEPEERVLVEDWCQQNSSHSVGDLGFDSTGALYASGGEGAGFYDVDYGQAGWPNANQCGDPPGAVGEALAPPDAEGGALRAQDLRTPGDPVGLGGTVIRVDPDTGEGLPTNPLAASPDPNARRILAYGYRNPFRFAIDPEADELYVGNVGWSGWEEIDRMPLLPSSAQNSGWPCYEGPGPEPAYAGLGLDLCADLYAEPGTTLEPMFAFEHLQEVVPDDDCYDSAITGSAISAMAVYPEDGTFPDEYDRALFFADPVRGCIFVMFAGEDGRPDPDTATNFLSQGGLYPGVDLLVGPDGDLYYLQIFASEVEDGILHRISFDELAPRARLAADRTFGSLDPDFPVQFDGTGSSDPQGGTLSYAWDLDGDGAFDDSTSPAPGFTYTSPTNVEVGLRVTDPEGRKSFDRLTIYPGDTPPRPVIATPTADLRWGVGQQISFSGLAEDDEEGSLPAESLRWRTRILHCPSACHAHPYQGLGGVASGTVRAPEHEYPSSIVLTLTATDGRGLSGTASIELAAAGVELRLASEPPGVELGAGGSTGPAPFSATFIRDGRLTLSAPPSAEVNGQLLPFSGWSDGGARVHAVTAAAPTTYTAYYGERSSPPPPEPRQRLRLLKRPAKETHRRFARFAFGLEGASDYRCRLDGRPWARCASPRVYRGLRPGRHAFRVLATADGGEVLDRRLYRWRVLPASRRR